MGRKTNSSSNYVECDGIYITRPLEIANYFNTFFTNKIVKLRDNMAPTTSYKSDKLIKKNNYEGKRMYF